MAFPIETSAAEILAVRAQERSIAVERFYNIRAGFIRLTYKKHQEMLFQSQSNLLGRVTARIFSNKALSAHLLREAQLPVPADTLAQSEDDVVAFLGTHSPIVVKPLNATGGKSVFLDITQEADARAAYQVALASNDLGELGVVCQEQVSGKDYRILVVDQEQVFTVERVPAYVTGDGTRTIQELIDAKNEAGAPGYEIPINETTHKMLANQNMLLGDIPDIGQRVQLMQAANSHLGGTVVNADSELGTPARKIALDVAKQFDCPVLGLDCLSQNLRESIGHTIELNEAPALYKHEYPDEGPGQPVGSAILDMLFPETASSVAETD